MLQSIINFLPELALCAGICHLLILAAFSFDAPRVYASGARFWLIISLLLSILFYDRQIVGYLQYNAYTLLFTIIGDIGIYALFFLTSTWFTAKNITGCAYNILLLISIICFNVMLASVNLMIVFGAFSTLFIINEGFYYIYHSEDETDATNNYSTSLIILAIFIISFAYLWYRVEGTLEFAPLQEFFIENKTSLAVYSAMIGLIIPFLYLLGIAPFHNVLETRIGKSILPVAHYEAVILPIFLWGEIIKMAHLMFLPYAASLTLALSTLGIFSMIVGAIAANTDNKIQQLYMHSSMYHFGIVLILLSLADISAEFAGFIYLFMYMTGLAAAYSVGYNLKSHGEYLLKVSSLSGLAQTRPCSANILLLSLFSIIGLPPLAGFIGQISLVNQLINQGKYIYLIVIYTFLVWLTKAYLQMIRTIYFQQKIKIFDTENKKVLMIMFLMTIIILSQAFNPLEMVEKIKDMFYVIAL
ncbi:MAG: hypothetical protein IJ864_02155 [Alphaproteobacteria bacterium]|nr:hypothetical protein [Alphaproteobacteria bacterium]